MSQGVTDPTLRIRLDEPYEAAIEKATAALKEQGFGVLTSIDVKATLKQKLDVEFRPYTILGACNPPFAYRALSTDLDIGLLLPCNVIVYADDDGSSVVSIVDPIGMLAAGGNPDLEPLAADVRARLELVAAALRG
jgi:uncharacterized protein (DUF302 family)